MDTSTDVIQEARQTLHRALKYIVIARPDYFKKPDLLNEGYCFTFMLREGKKKPDLILIQPTILVSGINGKTPVNHLYVSCDWASYIGTQLFNKLSKDTQLLIKRDFFPFMIGKPVFYFREFVNFEKPPSLSEAMYAMSQLGVLLKEHGVKWKDPSI